MTLKYRREHLAHCRAYDKIWNDLNRDRKSLSSAALYWREPIKRRAQFKAWQAKNQEKIKRYKSAVLTAEDMIMEALEG